ncbi:cobalamin-dependent protein [Clostridium sp. CX1]|uniref:B12-binding domain-containing radical SAM protein n=1 Tax=Clostridium sp. CX1 TaxID=2978346 RepID=UPI0021C0496A|nr:B12-binding domain-containing radical SAM protein [Clostridium sp. CX1]MCT8976127.1 cobalamin-dependent protein [Clostridium sp. CX1]
MLKVLFLFPNSSNEGVVSNAITILAPIAKRLGCEVEYFETSFYHKKPTAAEDRTFSGEFKPVKDQIPKKEMKPYESMFKEFNYKIKEFEPDILAVSANSLEYDLFLQLIQNVEFDNKPFTFVGGVHATFSPQQVIENKYVDAICIGEGEEAFEEFIEKYKENCAVTDIKNIWVKENGKIFKNPIRDLISEDRLWEYETDYEFYNSEDYFLKPFEGKMYKKAIIELSRGCPYNCNYCVNTALKNLYKDKGKFVRFKEIDKLKQDILNKKEQGFNLIQFLDENFLNISEEKLEDFCGWYKEHINLPIIIQARPESVCESKIRLLSSMGVHIEMSCGVETGSKRILNEICNRFTTHEQTINAFKLMHRYKIYSRAYVMIGFPTETREEVFETINLVRKINPYLSIMSIFFPFVGVPLREYCIKNGFITGNEMARTFTEQSILRNQKMTPMEISNFRRVYSLYVNLPRKYFAEIEECEKNFDEIKFKKLVDLSWKLRSNWPNYELD